MYDMQQRLTVQPTHPAVIKGMVVAMPIALSLWAILLHFAIG